MRGFGFCVNPIPGNIRLHPGTSGYIRPIKKICPKKKCVKAGQGQSRCFLSRPVGNHPNGPGQLLPESTSQGMVVNRHLPPPVDIFKIRELFRRRFGKLLAPGKSSYSNRSHLRSLNDHCNWLTTMILPV